MSDHTRIFFVGLFQPYFPQQLFCVACIIFALTMFKDNALQFKHMQMLNCLVVCLNLVTLVFNNFSRNFHMPPGLT